MPDLIDGESIEMQGSGAKPYILKNIGGVYSCTCPAWRNQSTGIERRTCKHLRKLRGEESEQERIGGELPERVKKSNANKDAPPILLAQSWDNSTDLTGWWISEKLDGVRAFWDGKRFRSRQGNVYHAPDWYLDPMPDEPLDGELWIDRKAFQKTVSIVRRFDQSDEWKRVQYVVFDAPAKKGPFEERIKYLNKLIKSLKHKQVNALDHELCKSTAHLEKELARVEKLGGEGLMLRQPGSEYVVGRSWTLLKVKTFHDAEAIVVAHAAGKGRHKGRMGALEVRLTDGTDFSVGTGFSDKERETPPDIGSVIMFRFQELSDGGVPRFPSYVRAVTGEKAEAILNSAESTKKSVARKAAKKKATKKTAPRKVKKSRTASSTKSTVNKSAKGTPRYFEFADDTSAKFWEISIAGNEVTVRYGRIGTDGTTKPKELASEEAALKHFEKLIDQKTGKGYQEK